MRFNYAFSVATLATLCLSTWFSPICADAQELPDDKNSSVATDKVKSEDPSKSVPNDDQTATKGADQGQEVPDVLAPVKEKLVSPEQQKIVEVRSDQPARFTLLNSEDPEDYKRKRGIWISDTGNGRIVYMSDFQGNDFYSLGNAGHDIGQFMMPEQIWVDLEGKIYVADSDNDRIVRIDDVRGYNWKNKTGGYRTPKGVAMHGKRFIVSDTGNDRILIYNDFEDEKPMVTLTDPKISQPGYIWLDYDGNMYVSCGEYPPGGRIVRIPYDLTVMPTEWKVYEGQGLTGNSFSPGQVCITDDGLYITDAATQRLIRLKDISGRNVWEFGTYGSDAGEFIYPAGISQDEQGNIYVVDTDNDRIVKMKNIRGKDWEVYDTTNPTFGLRSPHSVYVWSPRPEPEDLENNEDDSKNKNDKAEERDGEDPAKPKLVTNPDGNGSGFAL